MPLQDTSWEEDKIRRQMTLADTLRKQALTGGAETHPLLSFAQGFGGSFLGNRALTQQQAMEQARQQQFGDWMKRLPGATAQQELVGPTPTGAPLTAEVPKDLRRLAEERQQWASEGADIRHPLAQAMAQQGLQGILAMPEKQAELQERAEARQAEQAAKAEARREELEYRTQAQREMQAERIAAAQQRAQESNALRSTLAAVAAGGRGANADLDRQIKEMRLEKLKSDVAAAGGTKLSAADAKALSGAEDLGAQIDVAINMLQANPNAVGLKTLVPDLILQRISSAPADIMTRAAIGKLGAEEAHALYGAAFSASEQKRANQFLPAQGDSPETTLYKMTQLKRMIDDKKARLQGEAPPAAPAAPAVRALPAATASVAPGGRGGANAPATFASEAEAEAAGLPPGTPVVINGVRGTWR